MIFSKKMREKVFCIGLGKTGTTSVKQAFNDLGYKVGDQGAAELLIQEYGKRNFKEIIKYCGSAEAFQDAPFCFKYTYVALDQAFPKAKFILTLRNSPEHWYQSLINFHSQIHSPTGQIPTESDLKNSTYRYRGFAWDVRQIVYGVNEGEDPYNKQLLISYYNDHNNAVMDYFRFKSNLLIINLSDKSSYGKMCSFLNKAPVYAEFPWENKSKLVNEKSSL